jgi:hypothetical protein
MEGSWLDRTKDIQTFVSALFPVWNIESRFFIIPELEVFAKRYLSGSGAMWPTKDHCLKNILLNVPKRMTRSLQAVKAEA